MINNDLLTIGEISAFQHFFLHEHFPRYLFLIPVVCFSFPYILLSLVDMKIVLFVQLEIELDPYVNRTGDIWHVSIENVDRYSCYGYQCKVYIFFIFET